MFETALFVFVGVLCLSLGVRTICAEERNRIFTNRPIEVTDVKMYNRLCGALIIGFGVAAEITFYFMFYSEGIVGTLSTLALIGEAVIVMFLYRGIEKKLLKRR